jgi:hypothetical protein
MIGNRYHYRDFLPVWEVGKILDGIADLFNVANPSVIQHVRATDLPLEVGTIKGHWMRVR